MVDCGTGVLECSAGGCRAVQGSAGQGVHMPKPKFSIKTEALGGGGVAVAEAKTEADPPPPVLYI